MSEESTVEELQSRGDFAPLATQASLDLDEAITESLIEADDEPDALDGAR
jgi:hypothetical protein